MSAYPALAVGVICIVGGTVGYIRTSSVPSIVAGVSVGLLYLWSANSIQNGTSNGLEAALAASALLFLSSVPRIAKGPVPQILAVSATAAGVYYGRVYNARR